MKKLLILFALLVAFTATEATAKTKAKPFYDVKSQIIGVSGSIDSLCARGFERKVFKNPIEINVTLPEIEGKNKKKGFNKEQIAEITKQLEEQNVARKVLDYLFLDKDGKISPDLMNQRAMQNARFTDIENANATSIGAESGVESLLRDDWKPLLKNNYIYLEKEVDGFANFIIYRVDFEDEADVIILKSMKNPEYYDDIHTGLTFLYTGAEKIKNPQKFLRKLSENVSTFAIRGQLTGRNPAQARIGSDDGLQIGDMVSVYRQGMDKNGEMVSNRVSRARVCAIEDQNCQMFFTDGTKGSYKDGDMVVLSPDKKQGVGIYANYSLGRFFGVSLTWDRILHVTKAGFSGRLLAQGKVDYADYDKKVYSPEYNAPIILNAGAGYGLAWTLLGRFEVMPYVMAEAEYIRAFGKKGYNDIHAFGIRGSGGVRFDINIAYPIKFSFGAEYAYVFGLDMSKGGATSNNDSAVWVHYKTFKNAFKNNGLNKSLNRNGINFFAGIRYVF